MGVALVCKMNHDLSNEIALTTMSVSNSPNSFNNGLDYQVEEDLPPSYDTLNEDQPPPYSPSFRASNRIFDIPEAPPDYFSVVSTRIQDARRESDGVCSFLMKVMQTLLCMIGLIVLFIILISVPMAMLGVGAGYYGQCPIEPYIPIYLIVAGLCGIIKSLETLMKQFIVCFKCSCLKTWQRHPKLKYLFVVWRICDLIFNLSLFGWIIAGSYWIFHVYRELYDKDFSRTLCHPVLYKFAFGMMVSSYIVVGLTCCCVCGCSLCRNPPASEEETRRERRREQGRETHENEVNENHENDGNIEMESFNLSSIHATNHISRTETPPSLHLSYETSQ